MAPPERPPHQRIVSRPHGPRFPGDVVRDLLGIVRALYRAENEMIPSRAQRLRDLEMIGRELGATLELARKSPDPDSLGHRAAWDRAERALARLATLVDDAQPLRPALDATAAKVRR